MLKIFFACVSVLVISAGAFAQDGTDQPSVAQRYADLISEDSVRAYLSVLAADSLEGRATGKPGQKKAARFLESKLKSFGVEELPGHSGYFQPFALHAFDFKQVKATVGGKEWKVVDDFFTTSTLNDTTIRADEVVFLGYGISTDLYDNYGDEDYTGKIGVIYDGQPNVGGKYLANGETYPSGIDLQRKLRLAREKGLEAVLVVRYGYSSNIPRYRRFFRGDRLYLERPFDDVFTHFYISQEALKTIFSERDIAAAEEAMKKGEDRFELRAEIPVEFEFSADRGTVITENVVGYIEGSTIPDEYVFITAHYDHIGVIDGKINYGADDNGSGTAMVLELARVFAEARKEGKQPDRSVVFLFFTAEEIGLLGSEFYTDNPIVPLRNTVTDLNIDMIGRTDEIYTDNQDDTPYIYLIGADRISQRLHDISEEVNDRYTQLKLDYKYNDPNDPQRLYYRSDHYNFARYGIPSIFYFRGLHPDYHKPTDTIDKVEFDTIVHVGKLVFHTAWAVSDMEGSLLPEED